MKRGRGTAESELRDLDQRRTKLADDLGRQETALAEAREALTTARQREAEALLDAPDSGAARKVRVDAEAALAAATSDLDLTRLASVELQRRTEAQQKMVMVERREAETARLREMLAANVEASKAFASKHAESVDAKRLLQATRERVRAQQRVVLDLGGDRLEADEAIWHDGLELAEFLMGTTPLTPLADAERDARQRELDAENAKRRDRIRWLEQAEALARTRWGTEETQARVEAFFAAVPEALLGEVRDAYAAARAEVEGRRGFVRV